MPVHVVQGSSAYVLKKSNDLNTYPCRHNVGFLGCMLVVWRIRVCQAVPLSVAVAGRRYDVLLKADKPVGNYWLTALVVNSTRIGSPAGYGVLRYAGANETLLPWEPILQPESLPAWTFGTVSKVYLSSHTS